MKQYLPYLNKMRPYFEVLPGSADILKNIIINEKDWKYLIDELLVEHIENYRQDHHNNYVIFGTEGVTNLYDNDHGNTILTYNINTPYPELKWYGFATIDQMALGIVAVAAVENRITQISLHPEKQLIKPFHTDTSNYIKITLKAGSRISTVDTISLLDVI